MQQQCKLTAAQDFNYNIQSPSHEHELNMKLIWQTWKLSWRNIQGADAGLLNSSNFHLSRETLASFTWLLRCRHQPCNFKNKNFTLSALRYLVWSYFYAGYQRARKSCRTSSTKGMMLNKDYATATANFHTLMSEAATRCPLWQSRGPLGNF